MMHVALVPDISQPLHLCPACRAQPADGFQKRGVAVSDPLYMRLPPGWWILFALAFGAAFWTGLLMLLL